MVGQAAGTHHPQPRHRHESTVGRASKPGRPSDGNAEDIVHTVPDGFNFSRHVRGVTEDFRNPRSPGHQTRLNTTQRQVRQIIQ